SEGATLEKDQISLVSLIDTKHTEKTITTSNTWAGSNISAGNLNINANQNVAIIASDIKVQNNADIQGENILVGGREATTDTTHDSITETKTLTVGVKNGYVDVVLAIQALKDAKKAIGAAKDAYSDAKQKVAEGKLPKSDLDFYKINLAAATANVASATTAVYASGAAAAAAASTSMGTGFYVSGGATTQTDTSSTTRTQGTWNGSNINVGGNTSLTSNNNLNIEGSNIDTAGQLALNAKNINITAGTNTDKESTESRSEGASTNVSISFTEGFKSIASVAGSGSVNGSKSNSDSQSTQYVNSGLNAGSIVSNSDNLTIEGGNLNATDIDITTDNLVVTSLQDTGQSSSKSSGGSVGFGSSNNVGINASQSNADSAWVNQQSGITGGTVNITAKDTTLTGAVIAAVDDKGNSTDKLTLTTDTLTVADLQDSDNSKSMGIDLSLSKNTTKVGGSFNGHEKDQTTKATVGLGNVTVGGLSIEESIDQQPEFANLNREAGNSQEITKDMELGGLDASVTVDNESIVAIGEAVANAADYVADEIAVMGDNLPEELRSTLGQTGEDFVDGLIRQDFSTKEIEELLTKDKIRQGLAGAESANQALSGQTDSQGTDIVPTSTTASTDTNTVDESGEVNLGYITITGSTEVTALQVGSAGLGKIQQELDELRETNPEKAKVIETVIGLATGGPLKTAIGEAINQGIELASSTSDNVANAMGTVAGYADDALNWVGGIIEKDNAENFALNVADEHANPTEELGELGNSSADVKDGIRLVATISGAGIGVGKKQTGTSETSGVGSVPEGNLVKNVEVPNTNNLVWDSISNAGLVHPGSVIPQNFELSLANGQKIWVDGNATKHLAETSASKAQNFTPEAVRLNSQVQLESLQSAVNTATSSPLSYRQMIKVDGWELIFAKPKVEGQLPALYHARYTSTK
ncbi:hemagglutinin repeat-containing protein, partial [Marinomonas primoryensis]